MAEPEPIADTADVPVRSPLDRGAATAWLSAFEVLLCSGFPSQILLSLLLMGLGFATASGDGLSFDFVVILSVLDTAVVLGLVVLFLKSRGESLRAVLLGRAPIGGEVWRGIALAPVVFAIVLVGGLLIQSFAPFLHNVPENPLQAMLDSPYRLAVFAVIVVVAGGLREEVQRAFILHRFRHDLGGAWLGLIVFSVAFGLGHRVQGDDAAILTGVLGLFWGLVYLSRGSVVAPIVSHALFNLGELAIFHYASKAGLIGQ